MNKTLTREIEVAFSKHAQPTWFRIAKWCAFIAGMYIFRGDTFFWIFISLFAVVGIGIHLLWRYKTKGWTQSWIGWDFEKNRPR